MPETQAVKFRRKAAECDRKAQEAAGSADRQAWLNLPKTGPGLREEKT